MLSVLWLTGCESDSGHSQQILRSPEQYDLHSRKPWTPETVTLRNLGDQIVVNPRIVVNDRRNWFSTDSILEEIVEPSMSKRERAIAIWQFVVDNRYHDQPIHHHVESHDPVRLFNVYGYGFCDDAATNFMVLAEKARLSARIWTLGGHVVAEAFFDGAWHMFDADAEVYYLKDDGKIASVEELAEDPDLIYRHPSPLPEFPSEDLARIYTTLDDNRVAGWYREHSGTDHRMALTLRPGEAIKRSRNNWGLFVASRAGTEPAVYGNGRFTFTPVLQGDLYRLGATAAVGLSERTDGTPGLVFTAQRGQEAFIAYPFASPYPILGARVRIRGVLRGGGDAWLDYSEDGERRVNLWTVSDSSEEEAETGTESFEVNIDVEIALDSQLRSDSGRPVYSYQLKVGHTAAENSELFVESLVFENDFQHAPRAMPEFEAGNNSIRYLDESEEGPREMEILFNSPQHNDFTA